MATIRCNFNTFESVIIGILMQLCIYAHTIDDVRCTQYFITGFLKEVSTLLKNLKLTKRVLLWHWFTWQQQNKIILKARVRSARTSLDSKLEKCFCLRDPVFLLKSIHSEEEEKLLWRRKTLVDIWVCGIGAQKFMFSASPRWCFFVASPLKTRGDKQKIYMWMWGPNNDLIMFKVYKHCGQI